jgi:hypothetical protein
MEWDWFEVLDWWILKIDLLWQFIMDSFDRLRGKFITAQTLHGDHNKHELRKDGRQDTAQSREDGS